MTNQRIGDLDLEFVRRVCDRSGGSLDTVVHGAEVGRELALNEAATAEIVARLVRTGFLREAGTGFRVKITIRTIAWLKGDRERIDSDTGSEFGGARQDPTARR